MSKLTLLAAGAAGYVLGTRAGRERYEQISAGAQKVMGNPKVQAAKQQAQDAAAEKAKEAASAAADKVRSVSPLGNDSDNDAGSTGTTGAHTATPAGQPATS